MESDRLQAKEAHLESILRKLGSVVIAFSGGVDSTYLLAVARKVLKGKVLAVTAKSPVHPERETREAQALAQTLDARHLIVESREMRNTDFLANPPDRCYFCKKSIMEDIQKIADEKKIKYIAHGANKDDLMDYRPGFKAAEEMAVLAPLIEADLTKSDIRSLSKAMHLETWNKPAGACLATRIPYNTPLTPSLLMQVEQAEEVLFSLGFDSCRVRHHGSIARIELKQESFAQIFAEQIRQAVVTRLKEIGFSFVALDLEGYVQGSMNIKILKPMQKKKEQDG